VSLAAADILPSPDEIFGGLVSDSAEATSAEANHAEESIKAQALTKTRESSVGLDRLDHRLSQKKPSFPLFIVESSGVLAKLDGADSDKAAEVQSDVVTAGMLVQNPGDRSPGSNRFPPADIFIAPLKTAAVNVIRPTGRKDAVDGFLSGPVEVVQVAKLNVVQVTAPLMNVVAHRRVDVASELADQAKNPFDFSQSLSALENRSDDFNLIGLSVDGAVGFHLPLTINGGSMMVTLRGSNVDIVGGEPFVQAPAGPLVVGAVGVNVSMARPANANLKLGTECTIFVEALGHCHSPFGVVPTVINSLPLT
jgi:hypothetical protein